MGDVGDTWRAFREQMKKEKREWSESQLKKAKEILKDFEWLSDFHMRRNIKGNNLDFWPTSGRYIYKKNNAFADPEYIRWLVDEEIK